jgi:hypothetical protein
VTFLFLFFGERLMLGGDTGAKFWNGQASEMMLTKAMMYESNCISQLTERSATSCGQIR